MSSIPSCSESASCQQDDTVWYLAPCEWKVYILRFLFKILLVSASDPIVILTFLAETSIQWQRPSISFLGWQQSIVPTLLINSEVMLRVGMYLLTFFPEWTLCDCSRIIPPHNIKPSYNCRRDWRIIDYCNSGCLLFFFFSWINQGKYST